MTSSTIRLSVEVDATKAVNAMKAFLLGSFSVPAAELTYARVLDFINRKDVQKAFLAHALFQLMGQGAETCTAKGLDLPAGCPTSMEEVVATSDTLFEAWKACILAAGFTRTPPNIKDTISALLNIHKR